MADLILFHHAQGLTPGVHAFADRLRAKGHRVTVPDLFDGATFATVDEGVAHAEKIGFDVITERGVEAAAALPDGSAYAGFSLGALPAQKLAQSRPGALAALIYHGGVPASMFSDSWPSGVALQVHLNDADEWSEPDVATDLVAGAADGELFLYPGSSHLFTDSSLADYAPQSAGLVLDRTLALLRRWP
jgi:dienelactone hydrolase